MNYIRALEILEIDRNECITIELIKKRYKKKALKLHPDKTRNTETSDDFCEVFDAYEFLTNYECSEETFSVLNFKDNIIYELMQVFDKYKVESFCFKYIDKYVSKIENEKLLKIQKFLIIFKFDGSSSLIQYLNKKIDEKLKDIQHIVITPNINDLVQDKLYLLEYENNQYCIPLWHHELIYEHNKNDLHIYCIPNLPQNMHIDNENNIHLFLEFNLNDIIHKEIIDIGFNNISVQVNELRIIKHQKIFLRSKGISKINHTKLFDVNKKSDIHVNISLIF